jgi:O-antigen ligase
MGFIASLTSIVLVASAALTRGSSSWRISLIAGVVLAAVILFFLLPTAQLVTRFGEIRINGEERAQPWHETLGLIRTYPIFGCGLGAYQAAFLKFKASSPALTQDYAHNDYLQYFAELGAVGFALAVIPLWLVLARLRAGIRHIRSDIRWLSLACAGSAVAIGLHSFVDFNLYVPANMFTLAWILGVAAYVGGWSSRNEGVAFEAGVIVLGPGKSA